MELRSFLNVMRIANNPAEYADSLILIYTDNACVFGPFFGEADQCEAYERAVASGRPFRFTPWAHKG